MVLAWRVQPRNYLLFACHFTNTAAQLVQDARFVNYWHMGGREKKLAAKGGIAQQVAQKIEAAKSDVRETAQSIKESSTKK